MFVLRAKDSEIGVFRLRGFELRLGLSNIFIGIDPGIESLFGDVVRILIGLDCIVEKFFLSVLRAKLEIIDGDFGLGGEQNIFKIGGAGLRGKNIRADGILHLAPKIRLP